MRSTWFAQNFIRLNPLLQNKIKIEWLIEILDGVTRDLGPIRLLDLPAEEQLDVGKPSSSGFVGNGENGCWNDGIRRKPSSISSCYCKFDLGPAMYLSPNWCDLLSFPHLYCENIGKKRPDNRATTFRISVCGERGNLGFFWLNESRDA
jgi:hypothetical protein